MLELVRSTRMLVALIVAVAGSAVMYYNHANRAVGEGGLCQKVETHVVKLNTAPNGAVISDPEGLVDNIRDLCERNMSKSQAKCVLKASSNSAVRACK